MSEKSFQTVQLTLEQSVESRTKLIQDAINRAAHTAGIVSLAGKGVYVIDGLLMKSGVTLDVQAGVTLRGSGNEDKYHHRSGPFELLRNQTPICALIFGNQCDNCVICGKGTISGNYRRFIKPNQEQAAHIESHHYPRPEIIYLQASRNVTVEGLTIVDSPFWTIHLAGCQQVKLANLTINNEVRMPNTDGIDLDRCQHVVVQGCKISTGDDGICLKCTEETKRFGDCTDIEVTDCQIHSQSAAFKVGSSSFGNFLNVNLARVQIVDSNRGLAFQLRDGGLARNFQFSDVKISTRDFSEEWWGNAEPIYITFVARDHETVIKPDDGIENVQFSNINANSPTGALIYSDVAGRIKNIRFVQTQLWITTEAGKMRHYDLRPSEKRQSLILPVNGLVGLVKQNQQAGLSVMYRSNEAQPD